jgi:hypothetical protein
MRFKYMSIGFNYNYRCIKRRQIAENKPPKFSVCSAARQLLKNGTLITYKDFPHGMPTTQAEKINADLLAFLKS